MNSGCFYMKLAVVTPVSQWRGGSQTPSDLLWIKETHSLYFSCPRFRGWCWLCLWDMKLIDSQGIRFMTLAPDFRFPHVLRCVPSSRDWNLARIILAYPFAVARSLCLHSFLGHSWLSILSYAGCYCWGPSHSVDLLWYRIHRTLHGSPWPEWTGLLLRICGHASGEVPLRVSSCLKMKALNFKWCFKNFKNDDKNYWKLKLKLMFYKY